MKNIIIILFLSIFTGCSTPNPLRAPVQGSIKKNGLIDQMQISVNRDKELSEKEKTIINYKAEFFKDYAKKVLVKK